MQPDSPFKPYPAPDRELPGTWHGRRPWWHFGATALAVVLVIAGLAIVAFIILFAIALSQFGNNK